MIPLTKNKIILLLASLLLSAVSGFLAVYFELLALGLMAAACFFAFILLLILKNPFYGLLAIAFFLPFERIGTLEVGTFTLKINHILGLATFAAWILMMLVKKEVRFKKLPIALPLLAFILINLLSLSGAVNLFRAGTVFLFTLLVISICLAVVNLIDSEKKLDRVVRVIFISAFLVGLFGLFQFVGDLAGLPESVTGLREMYTKEVFGFPRVQATALEPLYFANYLLIPLLLAFVLLLSKKSRTNWPWLLLLLIVTLTNFVLTLARAAYIGLAAALIFVLLVYFKRFFSFKKIAGLVLVVIIVSIIFFRFFNLTEDQGLYLDKFVTQATSLFTGASYFDRAETISAAWEMFKQRPYLGVGPGNFGPQMAWHPLVTPERGWLIVNNIFLEILAETGILGLLSFLWLLLVLFFRSLKAIIKAQDEYLKAIMIALTAVFIGLIIQYQTFSILYIIHVWFFFGLLMAVQNLILNRGEKEL